MRLCICINRWFKPYKDRTESTCFQRTLSSFFVGYSIFLLAISVPVEGHSQQLSYTTDERITYLIHFPEAYSSNQSSSFPLLLFLHGLGERGSNIEEVKRYGPPSLIEKGTWESELPFIVISPQLPEKYGYWPDFIITHILDHAAEKYNIDTQRVYLTGLSLGGIGTWNYALHHPQKLAAILPVCGKADPALSCNLGQLPVWAFHGALDKIVDPQGSIRMIEALKKCKNRIDAETRLTLYPNIKHDSWTITYENPLIYKWLLNFKNEKVEPQNKIEDFPTTPFTNVKEKGNLREICTLPKALPEASGLAYYEGGTVWSHNDSGDLPFVYQIDTTGRIVQIKKITNAANYDWEDMAQDSEGRLYIGDFGNNKNNRKSLHIYVINNPESIETERIEAKVITFTYPDQDAFPPPMHQLNFDVEAMIAFKKNLYLFTKNRTVPYSGYVKLYKLPTKPGHYTAELLDSLLLDNSNMLTDWITGADISPDKKKIALLTSNKVWLFQDFEGDDFFKGKITPITLYHVSQKEGIVFINNSEVIICDEVFQHFLGGKLYHLDLSMFIQD